MQPLTLFPSPLLVLGGAHAGKSALAAQCLAPDQAAIVLGTGSRDEPAMAARIRSLSEQRPTLWHSQDSGLDLGQAAEDALNKVPQLMIDSISQWLAALALAEGERTGGESALRQNLLDRVGELIRLMSGHPAARIVVVTAEVGGGPAPARPLERLYRQVLGVANQQLASWATSVVLVHAGLPQVLK